MINLWLRDSAEDQTTNCKIYTVTGVELMPLELDIRCKSKLIKDIQTGIKSVTVTNNENGLVVDPAHIFEAFAGLEKTLPQNGPLKKEIIEYIGDFPLIRFVNFYIDGVLSNCSESIDADKTIALNDVKEFQDTLSVATEIVESFASLPWEYAVTIKLPDALGELISDTKKIIEFSNSLRVVSNGELLSKSHPIAVNKEVDGERSPLLNAFIGALDWNDSAAYLQVNVWGCMDEFSTTPPVTAAKNEIRSFLGLVIATELLETNEALKPLTASETLYAHKNQGTKCEHVWNFQLDGYHSRTIQSMKLGSVDKKLDSERKKQDWILRTLERFKIVFQNRERSKNIILASQWLFDSYTSENQLLSFVQTMIVLEILLGDKKSSDIIGIGELLRNRCAYMIGRDNTHRQKIIEDLNKIYKIRSEIVHTGKNHLSLNERTLFDHLRWMCKQVILREIALLSNEAP